jgi:hypothetical protein
MNPTAGFLHLQLDEPIQLPAVLQLARRYPFVKKTHKGPLRAKYALTTGVV